ncbi:LuxR family transcriptional regulator [Nocardioides sp. CER19]|uniref:LuxR family transcriptional regulator n=1 Tax=Nocardioides sp. CER19 TaxID=3038538 RepID=UPI002446E598|nr:LuxR family transcriptional regulator [Nocardioides sp. CER19]MDH2412981.1 LuxR family transcriptional regulator [Nocardioides sp. CER19]
MSGYGADERALFESESIPLYEALAAEGGLAPEDERVAEGSAQRAAFDLLVGMGLVHFDDEVNRWIPEDPTGVQSRVVTPLSTEGSRLLEESSHWAQHFGILSQAWRKSAVAEDRGPFTYLRGKNIPAYIVSLGSEAQEELLTAQPQERRETGEALEEATEIERTLLSRGVRLLTLYQHSARRSTATREYVGAVTELGGEVRTLDEFFNRMIIVDRRVAVIPSPEGIQVALAVREPTVVGYLVDVFMRSWERARPFTARDATVMRHIAREQRAMTMRMLIEGHSDPVSAKRLGVSPRTYAGYVADLKEEFDAETRFQLGYTLGKLGVSAADEASED